MFEKIKIQKIAQIEEIQPWDLENRIRHGRLIWENFRPGSLAHNLPNLSPDFVDFDTKKHDFDDFDTKNDSKKIDFCSTDFFAWSTKGGLLVRILNKVLL